MNHSCLVLCLTGTILLLALMTAPVAAADIPTISSISPAEGYNSGTLSGVVLTGSNFNLTSSLGTVVLMKSGQTNITAYISSPSSSSTSLTCRFSLSGTSAGTWDVVVVNQDGSYATLADGFTIRSSMTLTTVSPTNARTNNNSVTVTVVGTGLSDVDSIYLYNSKYSNLSATASKVASTYVTGTFDLTDMNEATYEVCVKDSAGTSKCDLSFEITTDQVGEIDISSTPSGAGVYVDSTYVGITPYAMTGVVIGSHTIKLMKDGYSDWSKIVKVTNGGTTTVDADLSATQTDVITTVPTSAPTTVKTSLKVTTVKVPTSWARTTTTKASPVEGFVILGAIGLGIVVLHRKY
ncbi:MAG: PEGA domain-containing protein [Methanoregula sp.]|jgi:hypothetical protein